MLPVFFMELFLWLVGLYNHLNLQNGSEHKRSKVAYNQNIDRGDRFENLESRQRFLKQMDQKLIGKEKRKPFCAGGGGKGEKRKNSRVHISHRLITVLNKYAICAKDFYKLNQRPRLENTIQTWLPIWKNIKTV